MRERLLLIGRSPCRLSLYLISLRTIVTAFSGNHQLSVQRLYSTLHLSPHTRLVAYILRSSIPVKMDRLASWENVEIREFDFDSRPAFMDLNVNKGEYAWKPQIIEEVVRDFGGLVLWMDTGDRIRETLGVEFWEDVARSGIWSTNSGGEIWQ